MIVWTTKGTSNAIQRQKPVEIIGKLHEVEIVLARRFDRRSVPSDRDQRPDLFSLARKMWRAKDRRRADPAGDGQGDFQAPRGGDTVSIMFDECFRHPNDGYGLRKPGGLRL